MGDKSSTFLLTSLYALLPISLLEPVLVAIGEKRDVEVLQSGDKIQDMQLPWDPSPAYSPPVPPLTCPVPPPPSYPWPASTLTYQCQGFQEGHCMHGGVGDSAGVRGHYLISHTRYQPTPSYTTAP